MDADSHAGTACLLLGLSGMGGTEPTESTSVDDDESLPPVATAVVDSNPVHPGDLLPHGMAQAWPDAGGAGPATEPVCTPAAVAAALMSALPLPPGDASAAPPPPSTLPDAWSNKQRRMQVSALPRKEWSAEEDTLIRSGVEQLGCRWRVIAAQLPGRSDDAVRNRWSRLQESMRGGTGAPERSRRVSKDVGGTSSTATEPAAALGGTAANPDASSRAAEGESADGGDGGRPSSGSSGSSIVAKPGPGAVADENSEHSSRAGGGAAAGGDARVARPAGGSGGGAGGGSAGAAGGGSSADVRAAGGGGGGSAGKARPAGKSAARRTSSDADGGAKKERTSWTRAEDDVIVRGVAELGHKWCVRDARLLRPSAYPSSALCLPSPALMHPPPILSGHPLFTRACCSCAQVRDRPPTPWAHRPRHPQPLVASAVDHGDAGVHGGGWPRARRAVNNGPTTRRHDGRSGRSEPRWRHLATHIGFDGGRTPGAFASRCACQAHRARADAAAPAARPATRPIARGPGRWAAAQRSPVACPSPRQGRGGQRGFRQRGGR